MHYPKALYKVIYNNIEESKSSHNEQTLIVERKGQNHQRNQTQWASAGPDIIIGCNHQASH